MLRVLCIGDPHFQPSNAAAAAAMTRGVVRILRENQRDIDAAVVLGDILHRHDRIDLGAMASATKFLLAVRDALEQPKPLWILIGNHDRANNTASACVAGEHAFGAMSLWPNTVVADVPMRVAARAAAGAAAADVVLVPYLPPGSFAAAVTAATRVDGAAAVFAHQEFTGAPLGATTSRAEAYPRGWPPCVSGHIHERVAIADGMVSYVGTPMQHGWASSGGAAGVTLASFAAGGSAAAAPLAPALRVFTDELAEAGVGRRATVPFASPDEFRAFVAAALSASASATPRAGAALQAAFLRRAGGGTVHEMRAKVAVASHAEFAALARASEAVAVCAAGVKLVPAIAAAASASGGGGDSGAAGGAAAPRASAAGGCMALHLRVPFASRIAAQLVHTGAPVSVVAHLNAIFPDAAVAWAAAAPAR